MDTNSRKVTNTDNLGAKIDTAKIPNGWKILFERISSTLYIFFGSCCFDVRLTFVFISHRMISLCPKSARSTVISLEICTSCGTVQSALDIIG